MLLAFYTDNARNTINVVITNNDVLVGKCIDFSVDGMFNERR